MVLCPPWSAQSFAVNPYYDKREKTSEINFTPQIFFGELEEMLFYLAFMCQFLPTALNQEVNDISISLVSRVNKGRLAKLN